MITTRKLWRNLAIMLSLGMVIAACGSSSDESGGSSSDESGGAGGSGDATEITILGTLKPEIATQFESALEAYNSSQTDYELTSLALGEGEFLQTATGLYSAGNAPTIMVMQQEIPEFEERLLDLSEIDAIDKALPGTLDLATLDDGRIIGAPQTVEAYGLLYNEDVLNEAVGGTFDPASIETRSDLAALMVQIEALESTDAAVHVSPMDWSLGAHLTNMMYAPQSADRGERLQYIEDLKAGSVTLSEDDVFNGWMDTVDLMLENNQLTASPLDGELEDGALALANGEVGLWFMGNWAVPNLIEANADTNFGIMPVPVSDNASDFGNSQISVGVPAFLTVDAEQSSEEQQAGAIDFINWLTTSEEGKAIYTDEFEFLPAYQDMSAPTAFMNQQILEYASDGSTLEWMNALYPADGWPTFGPALQQYVAGETDRAGIATTFEEYWPTVEG